jgi:hypothetical protein
VCEVFWYIKYEVVFCDFPGSWMVTESAIIVGKEPTIYKHDKNLHIQDCPCKIIIYIYIQIELICK